jgi:hypothetical protein
LSDTNPTPDPERRAGQTPLHGRPLDEDGAIELNPAPSLQDVINFLTRARDYPGSTPAASRLAGRAIELLLGAAALRADQGFDLTGVDADFAYRVGLAIRDPSTLAGLALRCLERPQRIEVLYQLLAEAEGRQEGRRG